MAKIFLFIRPIILKVLSPLLVLTITALVVGVDAEFMISICGSIASAWLFSLVMTVIFAMGGKLCKIFSKDTATLSKEEYSSAVSVVKEFQRMAEDEFAKKTVKDERRAGRQRKSIEKQKREKYERERKSAFEELERRRKYIEDSLENSKKKVANGGFAEEIDDFGYVQAVKEAKKYIKDKEALDALEMDKQRVKNASDEIIKLNNDISWKK